MARVAEVVYFPSLKWKVRAGWNQVFPFPRSMRLLITHLRAGLVENGVLRHFKKKFFFSLFLCLKAEGILLL